MYVKTLPSGEKVRMYTEYFECINTYYGFNVVKLYKVAHDKAVDEAGRVWNYDGEWTWYRFYCLA
jgi:hypothetical protein